jgi:hypothetical protein
MVETFVGVLLSWGFTGELSYDNNADC